jgi:hypothetical protein
MPQAGPQRVESLACRSALAPSERRTAQAEDHDRHSGRKGTDHGTDDCQLDSLIGTRYAEVIRASGHMRRAKRPDT